MPDPERLLASCPCMIHYQCPTHGVVAGMNRIIEMAERIDAKEGKAHCRSCGKAIMEYGFDEAPMNCDACDGVDHATADKGMSDEPV